jgi:hypothetical protein
MSNGNNKDDKLIVLQTADHPKALDAITPQASLVARKLLPKIPWVFRCSFPEIGKYPFLDSRVERP